MIVAFVLINSTPDRTAALAAELAELPHVSEVYSTAGQFDLVAVVRVRQHDDLADVVTGEIAKSIGITHTQTLIAFRSYSRTDTEAPFASGTAAGESD